MKFKPLFATASLVGMLGGAASAARADDRCDDYLNRHFKADLIATAFTVAEIPRSGDVGGGQQIKVTLQNQGNTVIDYPAQPGDLFHVRGVTFNVKGVSAQGYMRVPLAGGQSTDVYATLPSGLVTNCDAIDLYIDTTRTALQSGCGVYGNDHTHYEHVRLQGAPICFYRIPGPIHFPLPQDDELSDDDGDDNAKVGED